jgi:glyoxylase-like metal-dependent hydrolase (beta-lactamase superfamily II)
VPAGEAAHVDRWHEAALTHQATGQRCPRFSRTGLDAAGANRMLGGRRWQVIGSSGHDPESAILYQPQVALLISDDALWEDGFAIVLPELDGESGFADVRATLERLEGLRVRWVIPGHGQPFASFEDAIVRAHRRLDGLVADPARHGRRAVQVLRSSCI